MISFAPLVEYLHVNKISKLDFYKKVGISKTTGAKIFDDQPVTFTILDDICREYNLRIDEVVRFVPDPEGLVRKDRRNKNVAESNKKRQNEQEAHTNE